MEMHVIGRTRAPARSILGQTPASHNSNQCGTVLLPPAENDVFSNLAVSSSVALNREKRSILTIVVV